MYNKYTKELLSPIVQQSTSIRQVLIKLGLKETGGNYTHIAKVIKKFNIDRSHFLGQGHNKGKNSFNKKSTGYYLNDKNFIRSSELRNRLIKDGYLDHKCQKCGNTQWLNRSIPLELHHIDCNPRNNYIENLLILCPNCHKHIHDIIFEEQRTINKINKKYKRKIKQCPICRKQIHLKSKMCVDCNHINRRKITRPPIEQLKQEIQASNYCAVGRKYGVSDNAIRKWLK